MKNAIPQPQLTLQSNAADLIFTYTFGFNGNKESCIYFTTELKTNHFSISIYKSFSWKTRNVPLQVSLMPKFSKGELGMWRAQSKPAGLKDRMYYFFSNVKGENLSAYTAALLKTARVLI